jgi:hypothetical protein
MICLHVVDVCLSPANNRQLTEDIRLQRQEMESLRERTSKVNQDLSDAYVQVRHVEEALEAERSTHVQTKFSSELIQVTTLSCIAVAHHLSSKEVYIIGD